MQLHLISLICAYEMISRLLTSGDAFARLSHPLCKKTLFKLDKSLYLISAKLFTSSLCVSADDRLLQYYDVTKYVIDQSTMRA